MSRSWKEKSSPKIYKLSKKLAMEFRDMTPPPGERRFSKRRLDIYRGIVQRGNFRPPEWARAHCAETDTWYRLNGQHTATMFAEMADLPDLSVIVETYLVERLKDVAELYGTFDSKVAARTASDINQAFAASVPELGAMPSKLLTPIVTAVSFAREEKNYGKTPATERAERLLDEIAFAVWARRLIGEPKSDRGKPLARVAPLTGMFATYKTHAVAADIFWLRVRNETSLSPVNPDRKLARLLLSEESRGSGSEHTRKIFVKCLHAWNAWCRGTTTDLKYYANAPTPEIEVPSEEFLQKLAEERVLNDMAVGD